MADLGCAFVRFRRIAGVAGKIWRPAEMPADGARDPPESVRKKPTNGRSSS